MLFHWKVHEWFIGKDAVKSKIEIDPATQMDAGIYECNFLLLNLTLNFF